MLILFLFCYCRKKIKLQKPDEDDVNYIDIDYRCDEWIDCQNMSDEDYGCTPSIVIAFIIIGILTGFLILGACGFIVFTCVFGCCFVSQKNKTKKIKKQKNKDRE